MKILKFGLRFWITVASVLSFMSGWIMLAHAPKPAQLLQPAANSAPPTLEPLPPLSDFEMSDDASQSPSLFSLQPSQRFGSSPFFRTGGS
ncbi:MAG: hypothetical protein C3F07_18880 [Anaerolineales bacterium]|nr:hypothetical protein [Anaerolineae bacterium]PWB69589.1 MAG: hypothetical protein C3F07_18880 [Anaerolineales bacterium]